MSRSHASSEMSREIPGAIHERILRALGMARRPLKSGELENALALPGNETRLACSWLTEQGYIVQKGRTGHEAAQRARTAWALAQKGFQWARGQGALAY